MFHPFNDIFFVQIYIVKNSMDYGICSIKNLGTLNGKLYFDRGATHILKKLFNLLSES